MTKIRPSGRINEEHVCLDSFVQRLREIDSRHEITYRDEPDDPPDFWVTVAGITYATEVTSIVADYDYDALCHKLLEHLCLECTRRSELTGTYALVMKGRPYIPGRRTVARRRLASAAAAMVRDMSDAACGAESSLLEDADGRLVVAKLSDQGSAVGWCISKEAKWESEVEQELAKLFTQAINRKRHRFETKAISVTSLPIILLLYDAYCYGDIEDMRKAFQNVHGYEWVHSIFVASPSRSASNTLYPTSPGRQGVFLYTKNQNWRPNEGDKEQFF